MLGRTAGGLYWMFRYLERSENTARMIEAGQRIALTRSSESEDEWSSVLTTAGVHDAFLAKYDDYDPADVVDFLLRDKDNSSSVISVICAARDNARAVRTALTREVFESVNEAWLILKEALAHRVSERDLPDVLSQIRQRSAYVRGALHGTMMRNDIYDFARIGTFVERSDNTARILDVKYYVLLPSAMHVGSSLDNVQWETILRSVSAEGAYRWAHGVDIRPREVADFLILDNRQPRSLAFSCRKLASNVGFLNRQYGTTTPSNDMAEALANRLRDTSIDEIFEGGLHEFILDFLGENARLGRQVETDFRFNG